jgi:hypothetical protein
MSDPAASGETRSCLRRPIVKFAECRRRRSWRLWLTGWHCEACRSVFHRPEMFDLLMLGGRVSRYEP